MKPTNPMTQLEQWKANHKATSNNETKNGLVKNTQGNARSEVKSKYQGKLYANPLAFQFAQCCRPRILRNITVKSEKSEILAVSHFKRLKIAKFEK